MKIRIDIKGYIIGNDSKSVYDWLGLESTCPNDVLKKLNKANGKDVEVYINSGGGDIFAGSEIYTALRGYKGNVIINIVGLAASSASVIAMAGYSKISPTALFMIHNVSTYASGDYKALEKEAGTLKIANKSISNAYKEKTGLNDNELLKLMDNETWLTAEQCVELKFVDEVMFSDNKPRLANGSMINADAEIRIRDLINKSNYNGDLHKEIEQEKINLLKLKGGLINEF